MSGDKKAISDLLKEVSVNSSINADKITLFELKEALHGRGFGVLMLLFALPLSIPLPTIPGYTTILSMPLLLFSLQLLMGLKSPWLPRWLERKSFKRTTLAMIIEKTAPILKKMEKFTRPRILFIFNNIGDKVIAFISFLCAISIAIPLPLTNFIPAGGISLMSLGMLNKDGILVILGMLLAFFGLFITFLILIAGPKIVLGMFSFLSRFA
ncbi:exopolysaccharide biosynthesis protein [Neoehrlichia mikurensis]|uniref:Exopolysaccharide biosynthesis protein n=1 Tax=Neoehrlichia mikurensis TaxID=89586 RepID=A0A9Q9F3T0_9RICK|nr:exopolysaccharide biosynthesis protein [Neoehrlichia mikurensis]QXK92058.1 exopolysaccharide biosynthesis protein [Neoehrlichia mikurensis]QXK92515.1 exopolysaccharide biosynthesis protein [Neoehrlichia mikurensis]QXK93751.1 exopolysaccharide biosynthesis protein [Neoehrlichia mikurensis]UTO55278.1 exopolysaccharide biosynthesis protein [Neoehrlichia mikurensis]UTO56198.1 exopolysaccharide biosynthesis protein [Neoehrlichia mikurensis]